MLTGSNVCPPPATIQLVTVGTLRLESDSTCHWLPVFGRNTKPLVRRGLRTSDTILPCHPTQLRVLEDSRAVVPLHRSPLRRSVFGIPNSNLQSSAAKSTACPKRACSGTFSSGTSRSQGNILNGVACHWLSQVTIEPSGSVS